MLARKRLVAASVIAVLVAAILLAYYAFLSRSEEWSVELTVNDCRRVYKLSELVGQAVDVNVTGAGLLKCVPLLKLVPACGIDLNTTLVRRWVAVGADGYSRSVDEAYLYAGKAYLCLADGRKADWGPVRLVAEGLSSKYWVKQLVRVEVETGAWSLSLKLNGEVKGEFSLDDLERLAVPVENLGRAVPLSSLLEVAGLNSSDVEIVELVGSDGYRSILHGGNASRVYVLLVSSQERGKYGPLRGVVLGAPKSLWVHHLVAVELVSRD